MKITKKIIQTIFLGIIVFNCGKEATYDFSDEYYMVTGTKLHLREFENQKSKSLALINNSEVVKRLGNYEYTETIENKKGEWIFVQTSKKLRGFVFSAYLRKLTKNEAKNIDLAINQYEFNNGPELIIYEFNPKLITKKELEFLTAFNPYHPAYCRSQSISINSCHDEDSSYYQCGSRDLLDPNFLKNAKINIKKYQTEMEIYFKKIPPTSLKLLNEACRENFEFYNYINLSLYEYFNSYEIKYLKTKYKKYDPESQASEFLLQIERETDKKKLYDLIHYKWYNAMNDVYHLNKLELDEKKIWNQFLKEKSIKEEIICMFDCNG